MNINSKVLYSTGRVLSNITCERITSYLWHQRTLTCQYVINCTAQPYALPTPTTATYNMRCSGVAKSYWNYTTLRCEINCSKVVLINGEIGRPSHLSCPCLDSSTWNANTSSCVLPCESPPQHLHLSRSASQFLPVSAQIHLKRVHRQLHHTNCLHPSI